MQSDASVTVLSLDCHCLLIGDIREYGSKIEAAVELRLARRGDLTPRRSRALSESLVQTSPKSTTLLGRRGARDDLYPS